MAKQFRLKRIIATVPFVAGSFQTVDLPRGYDAESYIVRIFGSVTVGTAFTSNRAESPTQLIQRAEVIADGRNTMYSAPFWFSVFGNYARDASFNGSRVVTPPTAPSAGTYQVEAIGVIDFQTPDGARSKDTNFPTASLSLFQLRLSFGQPADIFVGAGTVTASNLFVEITAIETVEIPNADGTRTQPAAMRKISFQEQTFASNNSSAEVRLPAGNMIKSVLVRTEGSAVAGEPTISVLNRLQLSSGVDVRVLLTGPGLRACNNVNFGPMPTGYYVADVTRSNSGEAHLSELWDVTAQAEPKLILDVTGGANVKIQSVVTEYIGLAG